MPYFIILPVYALLILGLTIAVVVSRFVPRLRPASGYVIGGTVGTLPGFLLANVVITLAGLLPVWVGQNMAMPPWLQDASKFFVAVVLLIGPFVASAIGVLIGFAAGLYFVFRRRRHAT